MSIPKTYLEKKIHLIFWACLIITFLIGLLQFFMFISLIYVGALFLFRQKGGIFIKELKSTKGIIYPPVNGKLVSIRSNVQHKVFGKDLIELKFIIPLGKEMGLYLPISGEIKNLFSKKGRSYFRYSAQDLPRQREETLDGHFISISPKGSDEIGLQFLECPLGLEPQFYILPGDRGFGQISIGYFPFGGTVLLYLPDNYEIIIGENENVAPGETLIATSSNYS